MVHVLTEKGKGFAFAEAEPGEVARPRRLRSGDRRGAEEGVRPAHLDPGVRRCASRPSRPIIPIWWRSPPRCPAGTGTNIFQKKWPDRFFDVGIAEGHAVTFAGGLATQGVRPVVAIYSTFLQRAYDNIIHDIAVQQLPVIFCMDRAGLVGEDGQTHMGLYDIAYMLAVPGMTVTAPKDGDELVGLLKTALAHNGGPFCTRYPRDKAPAEPRPVAEVAAGALRHVGECCAAARTSRSSRSARWCSPALAAAEQLAAEGIDCAVVNCRFLKPLDAGMLERADPGAPHPGHRRGRHRGQRLRRLPRRGAADHPSRGAGHRARRARPADRAGARAPSSSRAFGLTAQGIARRIRALHSEESVDAR